MDKPEGISGLQPTQYNVVEELSIVITAVVRTFVSSLAAPTVNPIA